MRDMLVRSLLAITGGFAVGIAPETWSTLVTVAAIILGWVWLESRVEKIVKRELAIHTAIEDEWRRAVNTQLNQIFTVVPKRREEKEGRE